MDVSGVIRGFFTSIKKTAEDDLQTYFENASNDNLEDTEDKRPNKKRKKSRKSNLNRSHDSRSLFDEYDNSNIQATTSYTKEVKNAGKSREREAIKDPNTPFVPGCYPFTPAPPLVNDYSISNCSNEKGKSVPCTTDPVDNEEYRELKESYKNLVSVIERNSTFHSQVQARNERRIQHLEQQVLNLTERLYAISDQKDQKHSKGKNSKIEQQKKHQRSQEFKQFAADQPSSTPYVSSLKQDSLKLKESNSNVTHDTNESKQPNMNDFLSEIRSVKLKKVGLPSLSQSWNGSSKTDDQCVFPSPPPSNNYSCTPSNYSFNDVFIDRPLTLFDELNGRIKDTN
ncbi:hypothetical protein WALSEDRAFT_68075 [Wallemia mellicola CBS 633.66]|uniref:Uncharacterized protein n=2 Tax=Wallemia mellicola TaxID=1708541 RepID=A0A4T0PQD1_9BASI|nr:hypothetical protein WALSEDRAFT_68075 [Wallemia mellicola CBS 633.66]TIB75680.1 hypothetical protein E3Q23_02281 [Wallemia mellicola]EIM22623.1 hypothetical protein WALSEDRAFT_68075 [Wallemia mellicola CBS 633.66]TIC00059.1 hypothetical protein E3Q17_02314 [Wallemia mellicola]TIC11154.1 hypothetical protein E3Q14_02392 [Wallemia mellicola]TIC12489.1 hypothetical protein E3Q15_02324 [Wallemia mellicola]|eukprot:XP_006957289.1 hypothetical protein WALSEDRAFT_68075 [Wallemia mellicola CBS 633.66]